jgi:hypothetical protein
MLTYKDKAFCSVSHICKHREGCDRHLTEEMRADAEKQGLYIGLCGSCDRYEREEEA